MRPRIASVPSVALAGGTLALGIGGLYLAGLAVTGGEIDSGTTVRGVEIGGLSRAEAVRKLERDLGAPAARDLPVKVGERTGTVDPERAGLSWDIQGTVDRASRSGTDPVSVLRGLFRSGGTVEPVVRVDEGKARAALDGIAKRLDQKVRDGAVGFDGGRVEQTMPRTGYALDVDAAVDALRAAFVRQDLRSPTALPVRETRPAVTAGEVRRAVRAFAEPAVSAPVTLTAAGERFTVPREVLGAHLTMRPDDRGRLHPRLDEKGLREDPAVDRPLDRITTTAADAELRADGDKAVIAKDATLGHEVTGEALGKAVLPLLTAKGDGRAGTVEVRTTRPEVTRENAAQLGLTQTMSSFTVDFEPAEYRTRNIGRAVELINGSLVRPGETWSFNRTVGERTEANGFVDGIIILNDKYTKASGGGVSSVATTLYNALFFAGVKPVEHGAHSFYIERYPEGREATVAWGSLDLRFTNDSGKALYIQAESTDTSVTVNFLGTRKYDEITSVTGPRTAVKKPGKHVSHDKECVPQTPLEGFDVTVERVFHDGGREVRREPYRTHYTPRDEIVCE
ncbi:VanW family protein [Streptomyces sp. NPDC017943]|uniref:VanW family protein n=1 Tax=Streptomyces sp. NPDC017943 TaxID=3365019 RepID=UPI00379DFAB9